MSKFEIKMPKLGESITEGTIIAWNIKVGDKIEEDDVLLEVNTAKVSAEIPSPVAGTIVEILFQEGDTVPVGKVIAIVDIGGESTDEIPSDSQTKEKQEDIVQAAPASPKASTAKEEAPWYSPAVLRLAQEAQIPVEELNSLQGSGYLNRITKKDIEKLIEQKKKGDKAVVSVQESKQAPVEAAATPVLEKVSVTPVEFISSSGSPNEVREMDHVRKLIADHMVLSKKTSAHVTTVLEADVTKLAKWRERTKEEFYKRENVKLTFMPAIAEATAKALAEFPQVNASVDGYKIIFKKQINIGIAVSLDNGNLIVPVIHHADKLNLNGLAAGIDSLASKARNNKLTADDIQGGTFTITNLGSNKSLFGTPIINQPEVAILGVGLVEKKPAVIETPEGDVIGIRHKVYLSLSYDHRIIDGALGGNFLRRIADYLENWNDK